MSFTPSANGPTSEPDEPSAHRGLENMRYRHLLFAAASAACLISTAAAAAAADAAPAAVDLNSIPTMALDHVEVLRDGASAQYGSDAIAGVINLHLREARSGGELVGSYGVYDTEVKTARNPGGHNKKDGPTWSIAGY